MRSQAAKARKLEPISPVTSAAPVADVILLSSSRPARGSPSRGSPHTSNLKIPARQTSPGMLNVSAANSFGKAIEPAPKAKPRLIRLSAPMPAKLAVANTEPNVGPTVDNVPRDDASTKYAPSPPACDTVCSAREVTSNSHPQAVSTHATYEATSRGDKRLATADHVSGGELAETGSVMGRAVGRQGGGGGGLDSASEYLAQQRRFAMRERQVARAVPALPPEAEVLEVRLCRPCDLW